MFPLAFTCIFTLSITVLMKMNNEVKYKHNNQFLTFPSFLQSLPCPSDTPFQNDGVFLIITTSILSTRLYFSKRFFSIVL